MSEIFETIMLCAFGASWPINAYKSWKSRSAEGKSILFSIIILAGYAAGIIGKITTGHITFVFIVYLLNVLFVVLDLLFTLNNKYHITEKHSVQSVEITTQKQ